MTDEGISSTARPKALHPASLSVGAHIDGILGHRIFADCISSDRPLTVIWTTHHSRTSDETFESMRNLADTKNIAPYVASVRKANGQQEIRFTNGSRIMFGAREQGFGRGFDAVDEIVFDEAQMLTGCALDAIVPTTNASPNPLILFIGTPPSAVPDDRRRRGTNP